MGSHALDDQNANGDRLITDISQLKQQVRQLRTTQSQGSSALGLSVITGYFTLTFAWDPSLPDYTPQFAWLDLTATESAIMSVSLIYDVYLIPSGVTDVVRVDDQVTEDFEWRVWLAYSKRTPQTGLITFTEMLTDGVANNQVRLMFRLKFRDGSSFALGVHTFFCRYHVRATTT